MYSHNIESDLNVAKMKMVATQQVVLVLGGSRFQRRACIRVLLLCGTHMDITTFINAHVSFRKKERQPQTKGI